MTASNERPPKPPTFKEASNDAAFAEVVEMVPAARGRALVAVNSALVALYWRTGEYNSHKIRAQSFQTRAGSRDSVRQLQALDAKRVGIIRTKSVVRPPQDG